MHDYAVSIGMPELKNDFKLFLYQDRDKLYEAWARETNNTPQEIPEYVDDVRYWSKGGAVFVNTGHRYLSDRDPKHLMMLIADSLYVRYRSRFASWHEEGPAWLWEGVREFHKRRALSKAGLISYEAERNDPWGALVRDAVVDRPLPAFETRAGFETAKGDPWMHSFLAVELLASHAGPNSLIGFYMPIRLGITWQEVFEESFGMSVEEFYRMFNTHRTAGYPDLHIPEPVPFTTLEPDYSIITTTEEYSYTLDLPHRWVDEGGGRYTGGDSLELVFRSQTLDGEAILQEFAESVRDNLRNDWWPDASVFTVNSFRRQRHEDLQFYVLKYRVQESRRYCTLDVEERIYVADQLPGAPVGFRVRYQLCDWEVPVAQRSRMRMLDSFRIVTQPAEYYRQFINVDGVTIKANDEVDPESMRVAAFVVETMMNSIREDIQKCLTNWGAALAISPEGKSIVTLPEFANQKGEISPTTGELVDLSGGLGAVKGQPVSGVIELTVIGGAFHVTIHEFAHAVQNLCFTEDEQERWAEFYRDAKRADLFHGAYGMSNDNEFFAEFSVSYFEHQGEIQRRWTLDADRLTRHQLSTLLPEIFSFLGRIYEGWVVEPYVQPTPVPTFTPTPTPVPTTHARKATTGGYGYTIELPPRWVDESGGRYNGGNIGGHLRIRSDALLPGTTLDQFAETVRENLRSEWWADASLFEVTALEKVQIGDLELYSLKYRVREGPQWCIVDVEERIYVADSLSGNPFGFRTRLHVCDWQIPELQEERKSILGSFRITSDPDQQ